ncbi:MAG: tetratricopeptide repeat protein [Gemmatimonadetes bacterium]|uniref:Tetratricopeptide repeat protein n=1 Tax=Candidatus Kutchimonas denitrificans TaxID=3056748 RepID=A0AAE5CDJ9_9BACT|nr:tetratricopeptide repeat protein [Gemmatimonadota bacterium]NIR75929.1 tetratricopeptide repeat protein [Candidatus Kutchimonas denitrificans]NIS02087.1 tetratricopeptide repeat protein [Gemmatimonadota bacterium]NIT67912.1 tetratricopeptide repeat protein [Gemmatimonadota bacterium]NIU53906.1 tetratricopeptide repeat protein [Gemmatimonadota bacterium]
MRRELASAILILLAVTPTTLAQPDPVAERLRRIEESVVDSLRRELDRLVAEQGEESADLLPVLFAIRDAYMAHGAYVPATPFQERALAITEFMHGRDAGVTLTALHNLARLYGLSKDHASARRTAERLRSTVARVIGTEHSAYGVALTTEGKALLADGDAALAAERLQEALAILTGNMGPAAHEATETMLLLGEAQLRLGRVRRSQGLLVYGLTIRSEAGDFEADDEAAIYMAPFMSVLGALYSAAGLYDQAEDLLSRSLGAYETALGSDFPDLEPVLVHNASLYAAKGDEDAAAAFHARAERLHADNLGFAFIPTAEPYEPIAAIPPATDPNGLFASAAVGDWLEFTMNDEPSERLEIVRVTPALVVIARSRWNGGTWSVSSQEMVRRDIGLAEYHGEDSLTTTRCPFGEREVGCLASVDPGSYDSDPTTTFYAPDVVPLGGLLRMDLGEYVMSASRYRRGGETVTVPESQGFPVLAQPSAAITSVSELIEAAKRGDRDAIEKALDAGMDVNAWDGEALNWAVLRGHSELVEFMLARGARVGPHALQAAALAGHVDLARLLLERGADPDANDRLRDDPPLYIATQKGHRVVVELLLEHGADPMLKTGDGETVLMAAAAAGDTAMVRRFLALGVDVHARTESSFSGGWTAILYGAVRGHPDVVRQLLDAGADPRDATDDGTTTFLAAAKSGDTDVARLLIAAGADRDARTDEGMTALMFAAGGGHAKLVRLLIEAGADVNARDDRNRTALEIAEVRGRSGHPRDQGAREGFAEVVRILEAAGAQR